MAEKRRVPENGSTILIEDRVDLESKVRGDSGTGGYELMDELLFINSMRQNNYIP